jgi:hypothetical protein
MSLMFFGVSLPGEKGSIRLGLLMSYEEDGRPLLIYFAHAAWKKLKE